jgi:hypothetical protein
MLRLLLVRLKSFSRKCYAFSCWWQNNGVHDYANPRWMFYQKRTCWKVQGAVFNEKMLKNLAGSPDNGLVAQWITRLPTEQKIPGSSPGKIEIFY